MVPVVDGYFAELRQLWVGWATAATATITAAAATASTAATAAAAATASTATTATIATGTAGTTATSATTIAAAIVIRTRGVFIVAAVVVSIADHITSLGWVREPSELLHSVSCEFRQFGAPIEFWYVHDYVTVVHFVLCGGVPNYVGLDI